MGQHWGMVRGDDSFPFGAGPIINAMVIEEHMSGIDAWGVTECAEEEKVENQKRNVWWCPTITAAFLDASKWFVLLPN